MADAFVRASDDSDPETGDPAPEEEWYALARAARRFVAAHPRPGEPLPRQRLRTTLAVSSAREAVRHAVDGLVAAVREEARCG